MMQKSKMCSLLNYYLYISLLETKTFFVNCELTEIYYCQKQHIAKFFNFSNFLILVMVNQMAKEYNYVLLC